MTLASVSLRYTRRGASSPVCERKCKRHRSKPPPPPRPFPFPPPSTTPFPPLFPLQPIGQRHHRFVHSLHMYERVTTLNPLPFMLLTCKKNNSGRPPDPSIPYSFVLTLPVPLHPPLPPCLPLPAPLPRSSVLPPPRLPSPSDSQYHEPGFLLLLVPLRPHAAHANSAQLPIVLRRCLRGLGPFPSSSRGRHRPCRDRVPLAPATI